MLSDRWRMSRFPLYRSAQGSVQPHPVDYCRRRRHLVHELVRCYVWDNSSIFVSLQIGKREIMV